MELARLATTPRTTATGDRPAPSLELVKSGQAALRLGDAGPSVALVQDRLAAAGLLAKNERSGVFDARTDAAVRRFQETHKLAVDGKVGPRTLEALTHAPRATTGKDTFEASGTRTVTPDYTTVGGTKIRAVANDHAPRTTPQHVAAKDPAFQRFLEGQTTQVEKNTNPEKARAEIERWAAANPKVLAAEGITDIHALSPKQAIALSQRISTSLVDWPADGVPLGPEKPIDGMGLDQALVERRTTGHGAPGACRNFAELTHASFEALKSLQDPATTQLANTYAVDNSGGGHRTTAFVTVEPGGHAVATIADAAWNENRGKLVDYTTSAAHNDKTTSVRWSYFLRNVGDAIGDPARTRFQAKFDNGAAHFDAHWARDGRIARAEVDQGGGIAALSTALDGLEPWARGRMAAMVTPDVMVALNDYRKGAGQAPISPTSGANNLLYHGQGLANVQQRDLEWNQKYARLR